jgi:hypothetical protein
MSAAGRPGSRQPGDRISPNDCASYNIPDHFAGIYGLVQLVDSNQFGEPNSIGTHPAGPSLSTASTNQELPPGEIASHVWSHLPYPLLRMTANIRLCFDRRLEPKRSQFRFMKHQKFTPAEDKLLAWGIRKHVYNWSKIREEFLPHRTEKEMLLRKKNVIAAKQGNAIADAVKALTMPLTNAEVQLLQHATSYYGKNKKGHYRCWDNICRDHLPYRTPRVLSMLWSEWRKAHSEQENP